MLPSVDDKKPQISLSRGVVLSQSTFHLVSFLCARLRGAISPAFEYT